jgi:hypothetical protein
MCRDTTIGTEGTCRQVHCCADGITAFGGGACDEGVRGAAVLGGQRLVHLTPGRLDGGERQFEAGIRIEVSDQGRWQIAPRPASELTRN